MIHTIEALIEKRQGLQKQLSADLENLAEISSTPFWRRFAKKARLQTALGQLGQTLTDLITVQDQEWDAQSNNHSSGVFSSLQLKIEKLEAEYRNAKALMTNFSALERRLGHLIESLPSQSDKEAQKKELQAIREQLSPCQYADFEQRFRGGHEAVCEQLKKYLPLFAGTSPVIDLGCGRGEFVAMLLEAGIIASGIDLDISMLKEAQAQKLPCQQADILAHLRQCGPNSMGGIFSAQVIEHLPPDLLKQVVMEAFHCLKKDGLLLLETINPLSIFAFSRIYLLDTTHQTALHPEFMRYLLESSGFAEVEILYGPPATAEQLALLPVAAANAEIHNQNIDKLNRLLFGPSIYAVKGIKK